MVYVVNDLHGARKLIDRTLNMMAELQPGDVLVINGDGAGARGPVMNQIVKVFYEVRRGETDVSALLDEIEKVIGEKPVIPREWIFDSVHAGIFRKLMADRYEKFAICMNKEIEDVLEETLRPLSEVANSHGVKLFYLPGNGEITPNDFTTEDIKTEATVDPAKRFYQKMNEDGYFDSFGVKYVPYIWSLPDGVLLLSTHLLDLPEEDVDVFLTIVGANNISFSKVIVHYPPAIAPVGGAFDFWTPNKSDIQRTDALGKILAKLKLTKDAMVYFGHIHLGANDARMDRFPSSMTFYTDGFSGCSWVKPGVIVRI